jgi:hypothetical protein
MGQHSGIGDCEARMGQFLPQQQAPDAQQPPVWLFTASSEAPGTKERRSESDKAQAFCVIFMPHLFITSD